ncbi:sphingosine kinase [Marchantia polymorpha subsp. ruderalis]|uniref:DAGKc domain-containing protein n=2 Tax=Marchantia polymorpha TaxID=3197 RepID=A0A176WK78_MARPO|nr:hypothetical protein AXG93_3556s1050 [Marchantia polymorpha subsp. ruderalis]PTQ46058.1 hypothetical protein MARPO_0012s0022 [Marchantia polymorpha]PTQ46059.1 hypothetical protein MARPO_0012s0022 [Marchantia polymorpha]BBN18411.1 hypothetical protein Mp_8g02250 [Marchantia polymorpha subsp. ruderalis]BBN18412.1 hypothetical protein Mp_8g02250 [Marchantia polymorpha subsp. ruderalis]|eukprot:PTQ46058.1 hypothetical protein MARPO_0012s0022 [Marchantia polymorpha]
MRVPWGKLGALSHKINPLGALSQSHHQHGAAPDSSRNGNPPTNNTQTTPTPGAPKSRWNLRAVSRMKRSNSSGKAGLQQENEDNVKVDIVEEENSDLLGEIVMTGTLSLPGKLIHSSTEVTAKLTSKAFLWSLHCIRLEDIVAVSCYEDSQRITIHSYAFVRTRWVPETFGRARRCRTDLHFTASTVEEALGWVAAFAQQGCYIQFLPHPNSSKKGSASTETTTPSAAKEAVKCRASREMLVVLNPKSGRGRARKVFRSKVQPILELAGFKLHVVETTGARHAQTMAMQLDLASCPDGIICVGGDGIINEVLNGLLSRDDADQACTTPIGIIPAGSDNSLVWTVLGVRDPTTAALAIVKGGLVATDVFSVEWTKTGATYMGHTVAYYGFMSDVLELSAKYQGRFGPLRYFVAGVIRLFNLPKYKCEVQFLPAENPSVEVRIDKLEDPVEHQLETSEDKGPVFDSESEIVAEPRLNNIGSLPNHEGIMGSPAKLTVEVDLFGPLDATNEPSDYVRGLDGKTKRSPSASRLSAPGSLEEAVAVHPMAAGASPSPRSRSRSKSRSDRGLSVLSAMAPKPLRKSKSSQRIVNAEAGVVQSCLGDNIANSLGRRWGPLEGAFDSKAGVTATVQSSTKPREPTAEDWVVRQGPFLGVMICNHQCKTVQCLETQAMAPLAEHDDGTMDLLMVRSVGRFKLLRFIIAMQFNRHLSLPYVEYMKVRSVSLEPSKKGHLRCGIDGELLTLDGPILTSVLPYQCRLIGCAKKRS